MSPGGDAPALGRALDRAMEQAATAIDLDLYFRLRDVRDDLARAFCQGFVATALFEPWEPEYQQAGVVLRTELPAAIEAARVMLKSIGEEAP